MTHATKVDVIVGGQYGSEGKGAVAAAMCRRWEYDLLVRVGGSNAGHTVVDQNGERRALRQIPAAGILDHGAILYIAPGSELDIGVLKEDIETYAKAGAPLDGRLYVSPEATIVHDDHHIMESSPTFGNYGSTRKGVGAARAARVMRRATLASSSVELHDLEVTLGEPGPASRAMIEGVQGYWLGTHAGMYPYCTSSDCRAIDFLAMSGLTWSLASVMVVLRSFPIRIAGNSGPLDDEITWDEIGVPPEYTTVTKKIRRVGRWEPGGVDAAIRANCFEGRLPAIAMTFMDYLADDRIDQEAHARSLLGDLETQLRYIGNGPDSGFWL